MIKRPDWMNFKKFQEKRKEAAKNLKQYLRGRVIKGTESYYSPTTTRYHDTFRYRRTTEWNEKYRRHRKIKNKMARRSRRINRLRNA